MPYGKHEKLDYRTPFGVACFQRETWMRCPWCMEIFEAHDVRFEREFKKIKVDRRYGYYEHIKCGKVVAAEWLRRRD